MENFTSIDNSRLNPDSVYQEVLVKDCEEAINKVNPNGTFQKIAFILLTICYTCTGSLITNAFIFLEKDPSITCYKNINDNLIATQCIRKEACHPNSEFSKYEFNYIEDRNYSWTNDFKLGCDYNVVVALIISLFFIGSLISSLLATSLSDYLGRAKIIKFAMTLRIFFIAVPIIFRNLSVVLFSMFFLGVLNSMHSTIPYILLSEYLGKDYRDNYLTLMFIFESFSGIFTTLFFFYIQNWVIFFIFNLFYGIIFVIFSFLLFESPRFLYSNKKYSEAREVLKRISKINTGKEIIIRFEKEDMLNNDIEYPTISKEEITLKYIFTHNKYKKYIVILPLIWFLDAFAFFAINFMIKYIKENIYLLNTIVFISEAISFIISNYAMQRYGKRNSMVIAFIISGISFFLFYLVGKFELLNLKLLILILTFCAKFGASVVLNISSIYTNESFPTHIRGRATALCSFLGKFGGIIAPFLVQMSPFTGIISGLSCLLAGYILYPLENRDENVEFFDD
jgi:MFS transporter, OCT family, solute carrier family 22 (organic cation transporter), member 4/5